MMSKQMTTQQIVQKAVQIKQPKANWKQVYAVISGMVNQNIAKILRSNNTLFLFKPVSDSEVQYRVFNADTEQQYQRNLQEFMTAMRVCGFTSVKEA